MTIVDEFSSLGRIEQLRRSLKLLREYRVRCILMFQYIGQTYEKYTHDEAKAFINIKTKIAYAAEDNSDAEFISKMLGTRTQKVFSRSLSEQHQGISSSVSQSYQAIPLLNTDQIMRLSPDIALVMRTGCPPIKAHQFIWYQEVSMKSLKNLPCQIPMQIAKTYAFVRPVRTQEKEDMELIQGLY